MADFSFTVGTMPDQDRLKALFQKIMTAGQVAEVSFGAVKRADAVAALTQYRDAYSDLIGNRSHLIKNMDMGKRVTILDLTDQPA